MRTLQPLHRDQLPAEFDQYLQAGVFSAAEFHAARIIAERTTGARPGEAAFLDYLSVAIAVWAPINGHVCANLDSIQRQVFEADPDIEAGESLRNLRWPDPNRWVEHLKKSALVGTATEEDVDLTRPLVIRGHRLYLTRQWIDEGNVAKELAARFARNTGVTAVEIAPWLAEIAWSEGSTLQQDAVRTALSNNTSALLGGPGTGKTYTITAVLHTLLSHHRAKKPNLQLRVAVAAPTAKAARQITTSIIDNIEGGAFPKTFRDELLRIGNGASTIHRLLGFLPYARTRFKHDRSNTLPYDVVIIDEVSMVSLSLMTRVLEALSTDTQLILVGDGEQLKSVENGAVLPEIAELARTATGYPITVLTDNQRQKDKVSGRPNPIGRLATAIRTFDNSPKPTPLEILSENHPEILWVRTADSIRGGNPIPDWLETIDDDLSAFRKALSTAQQGNAAGALASLRSIRVLCAYRRGFYGVREWNQAIANHLGVPLRQTTIGVPLLNTRNDLRTGLVNGDTGIVVSRSHGNSAVFEITEQVSGSDGKPPTYVAKIKDFEPSALETVEFSYATTVHKSQGSQFDTTIVVCPPAGSALAVRELLYTAITRAVSRLVIIGSETAIAEAIATRVPRESELASRIRGI